MTQTYIQYGCGWSAPEEWLNFDASLTLRFERLPFLGKIYVKNSKPFPKNVKYGNIVQGLPLPLNIADGIYASHVLEHLSRHDCIIALKNTFNLLKSGGIFRLVVPDLECRVREYLYLLENEGINEANDMFMRETYLGKENQAQGVFNYIKSSLGHSSHLWMWDQSSMAQALKTVGFVNIRRAHFNDSQDNMFNLVEQEDRFYWSPKCRPEKKYPECVIEVVKP